MLLAAGCAVPAEAAGAQPIGKQRGSERLALRTKRRAVELVGAPRRRYYRRLFCDASVSSWIPRDSSGFSGSGWRPAVWPLHVTRIHGHFWTHRPESHMCSPTPLTVRHPVHSWAGFSRNLFRSSTVGQVRAVRIRAGNGASSVWCQTAVKSAGRGELHNLSTQVYSPSIVEKALRRSPIPQ